MVRVKIFRILRMIFYFNFPCRRSPRHPRSVRHNILRARPLLCILQLTYHTASRREAQRVHRRTSIPDEQGDLRRLLRAHPPHPCVCRTARALCCSRAVGARSPVRGCRPRLARVRSRPSQVTTPVRRGPQGSPTALVKLIAHKLLPVVCLACGGTSYRPFHPQCSHQGQPILPCSLVCPFAFLPLDTLTNARAALQQPRARSP